jgi:pyruvate/2-oxoglutarate dehydrogenase complex dihydrolipoamide dehydrogenase (E3) component
MDDTTNSLHADVLVIGWGKGGKAVAAELGKLGRSVVLVEQSERMYGGTCPNVGCVPSKGLVHRAANRRPTDSAREYYERAVAEVQATREFMRVGNYDAMSGFDSVTLVIGRATFVDPHTVAVGSRNGRVRITAETIVVDTGAEPVIPAIPGLRESRRVITSTELIESKDLPERLAILGSGYIGLEFASIYRGFGSEVTVLEKAPGILPNEDEEVVAVAVDVLEDEGIQLLLGADVKEIRDAADSTTLVYQRNGEESTLTADAVLVATGRAPASRNLGLEAAGVRVGANGAIEVDEYLRTSQPHIYALGNVNGSEQHTYISIDDGRIVVDQLLGDGRRSTAHRFAVPRTLFINPPFASVGLTEKAAREAGRRVKIASQPVAEIVAMPRAYAVQETRGAMKFVIDADTDDILGAALLSVDAQELINTVALAMRQGVKSAELRDAIYTHPSSTEAFNDVLGTIVRADAPMARMVPAA